MAQASSSSACDDLLAAIEQRRVKIGVIGLGYVGLPLIQAFVNAGFSTLGFDVDEKKVVQLAGGKSYIGQSSGE